MYSTLQVIHVLAAAIWFGSAVALNIMLGRLSAAGDRSGQAVVVGQATWFSKGVFDPAAIVTLLAGIGMVLTSDGALSFGDLWITLGFTAVILTLGIGHGMITPTVKKLRAVIESEGPDSPNAGPLEKRIAMLSMLDILILVVAIWAMVVKPL
jgi:uncharacterized membrane protein